MSQQSLQSSPTSLSSFAITTVAVPEPGPDWPVARQTWGFAWKLHWIGFGTAYAFLAWISAINMTRYRRKVSLARKVLFNSVNSLLILLGITRALYLFFDPYESGENIVECPLWLVRPLFGIAFPCLTSAFCLLHIAFLEAVKLQLGSEKLRSVRFITSVIVLHFSVVIVADTTVAIHANRIELLIVCQSFFIVWGVLNAAAFMYSGTRVILHNRKIQKQIKTTSGQKFSARSEGKLWSTKVGRVTIATSVLALACTILQTYSLFGVYGIYSKEINPQPWPWLAFQTSFRFVELGLACLIAYTVIQPPETTRKCFLHFYSCCNRNNHVRAQMIEVAAVKNV